MIKNGFSNRHTPKMYLLLKPQMKNLLCKKILLSTLYHCSLSLAFVIKLFKMIKKIKKLLTNYE